MWSRVGGDVVDVASLGRAMSSGRADRARVLGATTLVAGVTALDVICARQLAQSRSAGGVQRSFRVVRSVTVNTPG